MNLELFNQVVSVSSETIAGLLVIAGALAAAARWARSQKKLLKAIASEFVPNGGSSLRDSINRIEALQFTSLRMSGKAYWVSSANGEAEYISPALAAIMGGSPEQFARNGWIGAVPQALRKFVLDEWNASVEAQREFDCQYKYQHQDGKQVDVRGHAIPMWAKGHNGDPRVIGYLGWVEVINA